MYDCHRRRRRPDDGRDAADTLRQLRHRLRPARAAHPPAPADDARRRAALPVGVLRRAATPGAPSVAVAVAGVPPLARTRVPPALRTTTTVGRPAAHLPASHPDERPRDGDGPRARRAAPAALPVVPAPLLRPALHGGDDALHLRRELGARAAAEFERAAARRGGDVRSRAGAVGGAGAGGVEREGVGEEGVQGGAGAVTGMDGAFGLESRGWLTVAGIHVDGEALESHGWLTVVFDVDSKVLDCE